MHRYIIPFFLGFAAASLLFVFVVLPPYGRAKVEFGRKQGEIITKLELMEKVREKLGSDYHASDRYDTFFEVKADAVVVVERDGVKTLRNYVGGR
jgi:hypothetical protein